MVFRVLWPLMVGVCQSLYHVSPTFFIPYLTSSLPRPMGFG